jgi:prepilin-type N-terminal cleavage/methylation domain-containing protein
LIRRLRKVRPLRRQGGYSTIELLIVLAIMGVVMAGMTTVFVSGSKAELDMNQRFQAQAAGRLALDKLRTEIHCANNASSTGSTLTLTMPTGCKTASNTTVTWCSSQVGTATRWTLYRYQGSGTCTGGVHWADYLTQGSLFTFTQSSSASLPKVHVFLPVNLAPTKKRTYALQDDIYLRNSSRTCVVGSPSPPC